MDPILQRLHRKMKHHSTVLKTELAAYLNYCIILGFLHQKYIRLKATVNYCNLFVSMLSLNNLLFRNAMSITRNWCFPFGHFTRSFGKMKTQQNGRIFSKNLRAYLIIKGAQA